MSTRTRIGILSLALLAVGGALACVTHFSRSPGALAAEGMSVSLRWGLLTAAFWLAYPELARLPRWLLPAGASVALAAVLRIWWLVIVAIAAVGIGFLLRPRGGAEKSARS
jgi:hypothetical protein